MPAVFRIIVMTGYHRLLERGIGDSSLRAGSEFRVVDLVADVSCSLRRNAAWVSTPPRGLVWRSREAGTGMEAHRGQ